jgi:hypothetical protein
MPFARPPAELPAEERAVVERHLAECPLCRDAARREQQFDAAVSRAMRSVEVPAGLREQIGTGLAQQRGRTLQRRTLAVVALAASVLVALSFPLGWWSSHKTIDLDQIITDEDTRFVISHGTSREMVEQYFKGRGVRAEYPTDFDYRMLTNIDVVNLNGIDVAMLEFTNGPNNRARIYILPRRDFRVAKNAPEALVGSNATVEVVEFSRDYYFVIVYFGEAKREHFVSRGIVG